MKKETSSPAGIKEIAKLLGISIGTVDRALHARPGISAKNRARVLNLAEKLNYKPNVTARNLKLNRRLRIAVYLPHQIASFYDPLREGVQTAAEGTAGASLELDFRTYPRTGQGDVEMLEEDIGQKYDGIILTPGDPTKFDPLIRKLTAQGTPVVCVASDAPRSGRLASVSIAAAISDTDAARRMQQAKAKLFERLRLTA